MKYEISYHFMVRCHIVYANRTLVTFDTARLCIKILGDFLRAIDKLKKHIKFKKTLQKIHEIFI